MSFRPIKWLQPNAYDPFVVSHAAAMAQDQGGESLTIQSQSDDADINKMMARMNQGAKMPENPRVPMFGDFTEVGDYRSAMEAVRRADEAFSQLPANVRFEFGNNPQNLLEFASNPDNIPALVKMGLGKEASDGSGNVRVNTTAGATVEASAGGRSGYGAESSGGAGSSGASAGAPGNGGSS